MRRLSDTLVPLRRGRLAPLVTLTLALALGASPARAQDADAAALTLFDEGKRLAAAGDYPNACPKLLASYNLVQKAGTLLNLADCYEKNGQTASAWVRYTEAATLAERAGQEDRVRYARAHAGSLAPKLSKLTILVDKPEPGLEVTRDGVVVAPATLSIAVPVDPGMHVVEARARGKTPWTKTVPVGPEAPHVTVTVPPLVDVGAAGVQPAAAPAPSAAAPMTPPPAADDRAPGSTQRTLGLVAGGVGLATVGVGVVLGFVAKGKYDDAGSRCHDDVCTPEGQQFHDDGRSLAGTATVVFVAGAALLGAGVVLYLTAPRGAPQASVTLGPGTAMLTRTW